MNDQIHMPEKFTLATFYLCEGFYDAQEILNCSRTNGLETIRYIPHQHLPLGGSSLLYRWHLHVESQSLIYVLI